MKNNPDQKEKILRTELSYYRDTHKADVTPTPDLFKKSRLIISHMKIQLVNFCALLADQDPSKAYASLPSNNDVAKAWSLPKPTSHSEAEGNEDEIKVNQYYIRHEISSGNS